MTSRKKLTSESHLVSHNQQPPTSASRASDSIIMHYEYTSTTPTGGTPVVSSACVRLGLARGLPKQETAWTGKSPCGPALAITITGRSHLTKHDSRAPQLSHICCWLAGWLAGFGNRPPRWLIQTFALVHLGPESGTAQTPSLLLGKHKFAFPFFPFSSLTRFPAVGGWRS